MPICPSPLLRRNKENRTGKPNGIGEVKEGLGSNSHEGIRRLGGGGAAFSFTSKIARKFCSKVIPISLPEWNRTLPKIHQSNLQGPRGRFCVESRQNGDFLSECDNIRTVVQVLKSRSQCDPNFLVLASFSVGFFFYFSLSIVLAYIRTAKKLGTAPTNPSFPIPVP